MNVPENLKYSKSHEWIADTEGGRVRVGISDHAQEALGDLVFVELPEVGDEFAAGDNFAVVESVKATSDVIAPVKGKVFAVNEALADSPENVNADCYAAWFVELEDVEKPGDLLDAAQYSKFLEEEA